MSLKHIPILWKFVGILLLLGCIALGGTYHGGVLKAQSTTDFSNLVKGNGTEVVSDNINGVGRAAEMTGAASTQLMGLSGSLTDQAQSLQVEVSSFVQKLRAG
jgi:hypothetical protein